MADTTRAELRRGLETLARVAGVMREPVVSVTTGRFHLSVGAEVRVVEGAEVLRIDPPPELTTAQHLALSVLVGEPDTVIASALADYLLDQGHEYAAAVAEKAKKEERSRCAAMVDAIAFHEYREDRDPPEMYEVFNSLLRVARRIADGERFEMDYAHLDNQPG